MDGTRLRGSAKEGKEKKGVERKEGSVYVTVFIGGNRDAKARKRGEAKWEEEWARRAISVFTGYHIAGTRVVNKVAAGEVLEAADRKRTGGERGWCCLGESVCI